MRLTASRVEPPGNSAFVLEKKAAEAGDNSRWRSAISAVLDLREAKKPFDDLEVGHVTAMNLSSAIRSGSGD